VTTSSQVAYSSACGNGGYAATYVVLGTPVAAGTEGFISADLGLGPTAKGQLLSAFFFSYALMQIPIGWCADRFNLKWLYAGMFLLWSLAQGLSGFTTSLAMLMTFRVILGVGESIYLPGGTKIVFWDKTTGQAVLFAGTTVVIAILGLFIAGMPALTATGIAVATVVVVAMAAAVTLLPGLLGLAGTKIDKLSIHRKRHVAKPAHRTFSGRWASHVGNHPVRYAIGSFVALCVLAAPVLAMRIGTPDDGNAAKGTTERTAYDELADGFGRGFNGPIQVVVNNSGVQADAPMAGMTADQWKDVIEVSLNGFFNVTQPLLLPMLGTRWGRIVSISSLAGVIGNRGQSNYAAAKAGLHGASKSLAIELASRGVTVNVVAPGLIESPATRRSFKPEHVESLVPMKRVGTPEEVAALVAFLVSEQAGYITGQVIGINGGVA